MMLFFGAFCPPALEFRQKSMSSSNKEKNSVFPCGNRSNRRGLHVGIRATFYLCVITARIGSYPFPAFAGVHPAWKLAATLREVLGGKATRD